MSSAVVPPIYLHIGAMKTGTTYLQRVMLEHKDQLARDGFLFPGDNWRAQIRAAQEVAAMPQDPVLRAESEGAWEALRAEMHQHRGAASIVSMEFLSHGSPGQARAAVESLAPAEVHVVLTLRDAVGVVPAQWQTDIRNARTLTWPDFMRGVRRAAGPRGHLGRLAGPTATRFRRFHDVARIVEAWSPCVPAQRFHVVTVPSGGSDPTLLWRRFAGVMGLDEGLGELSSRANESMGYASTELLRRVNLALGEVPASDYNPTVREKLAPLGLSPRSHLETRAQLDRSTYETALGWNRRAREAVSAAGLRLVGDPEDLPVEPQERHAPSVADDQPAPTDRELLGAAADARTAMRELLERRVRRATRRGVDLDGLDGLGGGTHQSWDSVPEAVTGLVDLTRSAIEVRRRIRA